MPKPTLTPALRAEYEDLFNTCVVRSERASAVEALVNQMASNRARYEQVTRATGVPWHFVAVTHNMESTQNFKRHLHNGDPLTARTVQVPAGRPTGNPPFTWEVSAADALGMKSLGAATDWSLAGTLFQMEAYNGWGYRRHHPDVKSPYLWSFSNHYTSGKYVADGTWSQTAKSAQCGGALLLRRMAEKGLFGFADQPLPKPTAGPMAPRFRKTRPTDPAEIAAAKVMQTWLSTFPGIFLSPDGWAGTNTSDAFKAVTGHFLPGDPRGG